MFNLKTDFVLLSGVTMSTFIVTLKYTVASRLVIILFSITSHCIPIRNQFEPGATIPFSVPGEMTACILFVCFYKKHETQSSYIANNVHYNVY